MNKLTRKQLLKAIHDIQPFKGYMEMKESKCPQCNADCTLLSVEGVEYFMNDSDDCVHQCELTTLI
jgi:uncharacterized protein with PIN domain